MNVTVFHTTHCAFCKTEMQWLDSKGVEYTHVNIEENDDARKEVELLTGSTSVPVTLIDGEVIRGFDRPKLTVALGL